MFLITYFLNDDEIVEECTPNLKEKVKSCCNFGSIALFEIKNNEIVVQNWVNYFHFGKTKKLPFLFFIFN